MKSRLPGVDTSFAYSIYLCAGVLTWGLFAEIIARSQTVFLENANLLKKVKFPRICLPIVVVLNAILNFTIVFSLFTGFLILSGNFPGLSYLALVPLLILQIIFSIGLGIIIGILNVFFRDVGQAIGILLQFWFWLTPIVYSGSVLGQKAQLFLAFNPLADLMKAYQGILVLDQPPEWISLFPLFLLAMALCVVAIYLFRRRAGEMVDEL
jgi:lipopolysaccharide transport system permease protein